MDLTTKEKEDYTATSLLVVYTSGANSYLETHEIINGRPQASKPISIDAVQKLKQSLSSLEGSYTQSFKGVIPNNLIYIDSDPVKPILIWQTPYQHRKLYFSKDTGVPSKVYHVPVMVWKLKDKKLSVYASETKVTPATKILYAPFPNVHADSTVCMGNVNLSIKSNDIGEVMKHVENSFFNSEFNQIHHSNSCKIDIYEYWKTNELINFKQLVRHKDYKNLKELIDDNKN